MDRFKEARYYQPVGEGDVRCLLCPKECLVRPGRAGFCRVRKNVGGRLVTTNFARVSSYAVDPIEKKPLYHYYPGSSVFSVGTVGCNFACRYCQNWTIAHDVSAPTVELGPEELVARCVGYRRRDRRCIGIAYTYSEPVVWYEYVLEAATLARRAGLKNILVTNGSINQEPLGELLACTDAMNIDVKSFDNGYYTRICSGLLAPVKCTVETGLRLGVHVEVTTLIVSGLNDSDGEVAALAAWLGALNPDVPLHLARYFPNYKLDLPATRTEDLERLAEVAREHLHYVYLGNVWGAGGNSTYCPGCGALLLRRHGLALEESRLREGRCPECETAIAIRGGPDEEAPGSSPGR